MVLLEQVQQQYETLPYPPRDPDRELDLLRQPSLVEIPRVLEVLWNGRRTLNAEFQILDAGCGTGDNTIFMAEQLRGTGARITALDFSAASLEIARCRLQVRGLLDQVTFVQSPLEASPALGIGPFDFIVTTGVLHHLDSPELGLASLRDVLKPDGGIGVMVYARYGREPVYQMQALLRHLAPRTMPEADRLRVLRRTLASLPKEHRALRGLMDTPIFRREIETSDAGAYDLLLHTQDRCYTVPEIYDWVEDAALTMRGFTIPRRYEPSMYVPGVQGGQPRERHAVAELLHGAMIRHEFYAMRADAAIPAPIASDDASAIPMWTSWGFGDKLAGALKTPGNQLKFTFGEEREVPVGGDAITRSLLGGIDGRRDVATIFERALALPDRPSARQVQRRWLEAADPLRAAAALAMHLPA